MPSKKSIALTGLMAAMGLVILVQGLYIGLPVLAEALIRQRLPVLSQGFEPKFTIESVGLRRTRIRNLSLGQGIRADSLEILYAWHQARPFQVTGVRIAGLTLEAFVDKDQTARINGLVLNPKPDPNASSAGSHSSVFQTIISDIPVELAPFLPKQIRLNYSRIIVNVLGQSLEFPFYAKAVLDPGQGAVKAQAEISVLGQRLNLEADADREKGLSRFTLETRGGEPFRLARKLVDPNLPVRLTGPGKLRIFLNEGGVFQFRLSDFNLEGGQIPEIRLEIVQGTFDTGTRNLKLAAGIHLVDPARPPVPGHPVSIDLAMEAGLGRDRNFDLSGTSRPMETLVLDHLPGQVSDLFHSLSLDRPRLVFHMAGNPIEQHGEMVVSGDNASVRSPSADISSATLKISAKTTGSFMAAPLSGKIDWTLAAGQFRVRSQNPSQDKPIVSEAVDGSGSLWIDPQSPGHIPRADFMLKGRNIVQETGNTRITIGRLTLSGDARNKADRQVLNTTARLTPMDIVIGDRRLSLPRCGWSGQVSHGPDPPFSFDLTPWAEEGSLVLPEERVKAKGLTFKTRLTRPFVQGGSGLLDISDIIFQNRIRAGFSARLDQVDSHSIQLAGELSSPDLAEKGLAVTVKAGILPAVWADARIAGSHLEITSPIIKKLSPAMNLPGQIRLDVTADARASYGMGTLLSRASLEVHDGTFDFPDMNLSADGIKGRLTLRDLVKMESYPGQMLTIDHISMGQFRFEKAALRFRVEDPHTLGIENLKLNWCNGLVSSEAVQIPAEDGRTRLILFCDRLQMDMLLNQMGAFDARGGGTLSGRIPVTYKNGGFSFENGFLFSTPGKGGRVYVRDLDRVMAGFPKGTPESSYIEMAGEALKDFEYNWATLKMNSQGDTLNVNMELDGKPARILPFEFRKDINAFVRVDASSPGAHFQGIKLDLNLKLPFNQVTKFGKKIKSFMD